MEQHMSGNNITRLVAWCRRLDYPLRRVAPFVPCSYGTLHYHQAAKNKKRASSINHATDLLAGRLVDFLYEQEKELHLIERSKSQRINLIDGVLNEYSTRQAA